MKRFQPVSATQAVTLLAAALAASPVLAQEDRFAGVTVESQQVRDNVFMLTGAGGNIGVSVGTDGTLIVDDQFAPLADRILQALSEIDGDAPRLILNTHFHGDHTGANPVFGEVGTIVAHDNVRERLAADEAFPRTGLPVLTFADRGALAIPWR